MVSGNFDVVHLGHYRQLQFAKNQGTRLVVGIKAIGTKVELNDYELFKLNSVFSSGLVDAAFVYGCSIEEVIAHLRPSIVVKGREFIHSENVEKAAVEMHGGRLNFFLWRK